MTDQQASELTEPRIGSLHDPTALVAPQFASIFVTPLLVVLPVRRDQFDASLLQSSTQRVRVVGAIGNHPLRLLPRPALPPWNPHFGERGFRKRNFKVSENYSAERFAELCPKTKREGCAGCKLSLC